MIGFHNVAPRSLAHGVAYPRLDFLRRRDADPFVFAVLILEVFMRDDAIGTNAVAFGSLDPSSKVLEQEVGGLTVTVISAVISGLIGEVYVLGLHSFPFVGVDALGSPLIREL
jgi:hypothetical protein